MKKLLLLLVLITSLQNFAQNNAFTFNGIDQQIATYTQQALINFTTGNFTIEAWVKPAAFVSGNNTFEHTILGNDIWNATNNTGYVLRTGGSRKLDFTFGNGNNWYSVVSTNPVFTAGEWTHVAIVRSGTTFTLYADGQQVGQETFTQNLVQANGNLRIGENGNGSGRFFNGAMDEVKFWSVVRTQAQVQDDLNDTDMTTPLTDLKVYYKMNQTTGQDVISETAYDLFAKYLPTAAVNTTAGFFRIYTFITVGLWNDSTKWKNGFVPPATWSAGDIVNINNVCIINSQPSLTVPTGCTLNLNGQASKLYFENPVYAFYNYGTVNNAGFFGQLNPSFSKSFYNYNTINNLLTGQLSLFSLYGYFDSTTSNNGAMTINLYLELNNQSTLTNSGSGGITCVRFYLNSSSSSLTNSGTITVSGSIINLGTITNPTGTISATRFLNESSGIVSNSFDFEVTRRLDNYGTINNYQNFTCIGASDTADFTNFPSGSFNNLTAQSFLNINNSTNYTGRFINQGH